MNGPGVFLTQEMLASYLEADMINGNNYSHYFSSL